jgi:hypothetical protein
LAPAHPVVAGCRRFPKRYETDNGARPAAASTNKHENNAMTEQSVGDLSHAWLKSLQGNITNSPRTVADVVAEVIKIAKEADHLARELPSIKADDASVAGLLHRAAVHFRDLHTAIATATSSISDDLKRQLGIDPKKATP